MFNLNGDYPNYRGVRAVVAGAYAYTLEKGSGTGRDGNWYLRSEGKDKEGRA
ncbi:autotransporter outer membrane beta-barrel domain-containing protein [Ochrobactrum sp. Marseille-Q0166]|nr:autotransporter outer membrane beta-barrel domain-containing protein [Ochrobactrum sp. Marseille-Q0166]